jgi:hypothetical protein
MERIRRHQEQVNKLKEVARRAAKKTGWLLDRADGGHEDAGGRGSDGAAGADSHSRSLRGAMVEMGKEVGSMQEKLGKIEHHIERKMDDVNAKVDALMEMLKEMKAGTK